MKIYLLAGLLLFFGGVAVQVMYSEHTTQRENAGNVRAQSLLAFSGIVQDHVDSGATLPEGIAAPADIPTPSWFRANLDGVSLVTEGDRAFVVADYSSRAQALRVRRAAEQTAEAFVGIAADNQVRLPGDGGTALALPPGIPDGALVVPIPL